MSKGLISCLSSKSDKSGNHCTKMNRFGIILLLPTFLQSVLPSVESAPGDLQQKLFSDYNAKVLPVTEKGERVQLNVSMTPLYIYDLDEEKGILCLDTWIFMEWNDSQLMWNPGSYGNIDHLVLPSSEVWRPDITVYTASPIKKLVPQVHTNVIVNYTGTVLWVPPFTISARCHLEYSDYPEDVHECLIKLGSWTFGSLSFDLQAHENEVSLDDFSDTNPTWSLIKASVRKSDKYYPCCPNEYYSTLDYTLTFKRKSSNEAFISDAVSVSAIFLALLMFWLPPNSTHKIILGSLAEVLLGLQALYLVDVLEAPGVIARYNGKLYPLMCLVGVLLILEAIVINLSAISPVHPAPKWIVSAANGFCQPLGICISRMNRATGQKTDREPIVINSEQDWKLVAMVFDRVFFFIAFAIFVLFHKIL